MAPAAKKAEKEIVSNTIAGNAKEIKSNTIAGKAVEGGPSRADEIVGRGLKDPKTVMHHGTPREIIKKQPPDIQKEIIGRKGQPNRVEVGEGAHIGAHNGWNGKPKYNKEFQRRLDDLGRQPEPDDFWNIRKDMLKEYFGI